MPARFHGFWGGPPLSAYEELCLASLVTRGQRVFLYSYDRHLRVPGGVELVDANEIVPAERIHEFVYPNGERSAALHSDLFRYEVLRQRGGWYFDLDIVMLAAHPPADELYIARQDDGFVNGAIIKLPADSPVIRAAIDQSRALLSAGHAEWGAIGPALLTRLVTQFGLEPQVRPWSSAYPVKAVEAIDLFLPEHADRLKSQSARADFVHLWNEIWRRIRIPKNYGPPEDSFLDDLFKRYAVEFRPEARLSADAIRSWRSDFFFLHSIDQKLPHGRSLDDIARAVEERDQMAASRSWRLTRPLRLCGDFWKQLRRAGR